MHADWFSGAVFKNAAGYFEMTCVESQKISTNVHGPHALFSILAADANLKKLSAMSGFCAKSRSKLEHEDIRGVTVLHGSPLACFWNLSTSPPLPRSRPLKSQLLSRPAHPWPLSPSALRFPSDQPNRGGVWRVSVESPPWVTCARSTWRQCWAKWKDNSAALPSI